MGSCNFIFWFSFFILWLNKWFALRENLMDNVYGNPHSRSECSQRTTEVIELVRSWYAVFHCHCLNSMCCWSAALCFNIAALKLYHYATFTYLFLAERYSCIAQFSCCHDMLSVGRLSVTWVYCDKMVEARIMRFSRQSSEMSQLFAG